LNLEILNFPPFPIPYSNSISTHYRIIPTGWEITHKNVILWEISPVYPLASPPSGGDAFPIGL
jgi:hypothetical protein